MAVVFSVVCVVRRNRARGAWALLALDVALAVGGALLELYSLRPSDWAQTLKLVPLALIAVGCVINIGHGIALRRGRARARRDEKTPSEP